MTLDLRRARRLTKPRIGPLRSLPSRAPSQRHVTLSRAMTETVHVEENRRHWDAMAERWVKAGEASWSAQEPSWGVWHVPESKLSLLPSSMLGMDAIELGCGTGYVSAWMARRGARVTGIRPTGRARSSAWPLPGLSVGHRSRSFTCARPPDPSGRSWLCAQNLEQDCASAAFRVADLWETF